VKLKKELFKKFQNRHGQDSFVLRKSENSLLEHYALISYFEKME